MMIVHAAKSLFAWDCLEDSPSLRTIKDLLAALPDGKLLNSLRAARGKGRDDYPVQVLWGVVVLRVALRHITTEAVLAELRRNEGLRRVISIESESGVPNKWNMSRFEEVLGQEPHRTLLKEIFNVLIQRLGVAVADLGRDTAGDATDLSARRKPQEAAQKEIDEGLPQASGGRKEYKDDEGKVTKVVEWFGFKLHLMVDANHEVVLSYEITDTKAGDGKTLAVIFECLASVEMGQTACSNKVQFRAEVSPCPRKPGSVSHPRKRSPFFDSTSWNAPLSRICVTSTASAPRCSTAGKRSSSRTPLPPSSPAPDEPTMARTGGSLSWKISSVVSTRCSRNSWKNISN